MGKKLTTKDFIEKSQKLHGNIYDYSLVNYKGIFEKVEIICPIHQNFWQSAHDHSQENGCPKCGTKRGADIIRDTKEKFVEKSFKIHLDKYDYSKVDYLNNHTKVEIICKKHKTSFFQVPTSHLSGNGCPQCNWDYNNNKKEDWITKSKGRIGTFYIIRCWNENEEFLKFGITYLGIKRRFNTKKEMPYNYEIIREINSFNLAYLWDLEKRFKSIKTDNYYKPLIKFAGSRYECFK